MEKIDASKILLPDEVQSVIADLAQRKNKNAPVNSMIFRLSCCCGLRRKEICGLDLRDIQASGPRPCIRVRADITKGEDRRRRAREVPLWWDHGTFEAICRWVEIREGEGALPTDPFVAKRRQGQDGERMTRPRVSRRWWTAIKCLGPGRVSQLSIHSGRHTFCSHALAVGRSLVEVQHAAGHADAVMTSRYMHLLDRENVPDVFGVTLCTNRKVSLTEAPTTGLSPRA